MAKMLALLSAESHREQIVNVQLFSEQLTKFFHFSSNFLLYLLLPFSPLSSLMSCFHRGFFQFHETFYEFEIMMVYFEKCYKRADRQLLGMKRTKR